MPPPPRPKKSRRGWILGALAVVVVVIVGITVGVRALSTRTADSPAAPGGPSVTVPASTDQGAPPLSCGERTAAFDPAPTSGGMVRSGGLSFPELAAPFGAPTRTTLLQFDYLHDVASQFAVLRYQGRSTGGAEVMIARAPIADGFSTPRQVAQLLFGCVQVRFPGAQEKGHRSRSTTVDGHQAWLIRSHLGYGGVDAGTKSETIILMVVATTDGENGLFYADLPDTHPELLPRAERALAQLSVSR